MAISVNFSEFPGKTVNAASGLLGKMVAGAVLSDDGGVYEGVKFVDGRGKVGAGAEKVGAGAEKVGAGAVNRGDPPEDDRWLE